MSHHSPLQKSAGSARDADASGLSRRGFLKVGFGFTAALACTGLMANLAGCSKADTAPDVGFHYLNTDDTALFGALAPVVIVDLAALDAAQRKLRIDAILQHIDSACAALQLHQQQELRKLLGLLAMAPLRWALTGVGSWNKATPETLRDFLSRWRSSRFDTMNVGSNVLIKLISASYYVQAVAWPATGYPGPLDYVYKAVNS